MVYSLPPREYRLFGNWYTQLIQLCVKVTSMYIV